MYLFPSPCSLVLTNTCSLPKKNVNLTVSGHLWLHVPDNSSCIIYKNINIKYKSWNRSEQKHCVHYALKAECVGFCMPSFSNFLRELWEFWLWTCAWWTIGAFSTQSNMLFASQRHQLTVIFVVCCLVDHLKRLSVTNFLIPHAARWSGFFFFCFLCNSLHGLVWTTRRIWRCHSKGFFLWVDFWYFCTPVCCMWMFIGVARLAVRKARPANNTLLYFADFGDNANEIRDFTA